MQDYKRAILNIDGLLAGLADSLQLIIDGNIEIDEHQALENYLDSAAKVPGLIALREHYKMKLGYTNG